MASSGSCTRLKAGQFPERYCTRKSVYDHAPAAQWPAWWGKAQRVRIIPLGTARGKTSVPICTWVTIATRACVTILQEVVDAASDHLCPISSIARQPAIINRFGGVWLRRFVRFPERPRNCRSR